MAYYTHLDDDFTGYAGNYTQLNACDATAGWTLGGDGGVLATDNTLHREGTNCLDLPFTDSAHSVTLEYDYGGGSGQDISAYNYLVFWAHLPTNTAFTTITLTLTDDAGTPVAGTWNPSNYYGTGVAEFMSAQWTYVLYSINRTPDAGSQPDMTDIRKVKLTFTYEAGYNSGSGNFYVDDVRIRKDVSNETEGLWRPLGNVLYWGIPALHADGGDTVLSVYDSYYLGILTEGHVIYTGWESNTGKLNITGSVKIHDTNGFAYIMWDHKMKSAGGAPRYCYALFYPATDTVALGYVPDTGAGSEVDGTFVHTTGTWYAFDITVFGKVVILSVAGTEVLRYTNLVRQEGGYVALGVLGTGTNRAMFKDIVIKSDPSYDLITMHRAKVALSL